MALADHPQGIQDVAEHILSESTDRKVNQSANLAWQFADSAKLHMDIGSAGGVVEAMHQASQHLHAAATGHSAKMEQAGGFASPDVLDAAYVEPTKHHDGYVNEMNEGLKNGR